MRLYHASDIVIESPDVYHSREHLDFGKGFYLTSIRIQAEKYAQRFLVCTAFFIAWQACFCQ